VIQDLGYYPFGSRQFSDLTHYVRSGDFVGEMLVESKDANEYAFAMGAWLTTRRTLTATLPKGKRQKAKGKRQKAKGIALPCALDF